MKRVFRWVVIRLILFGVFRCISVGCDQIDPFVVELERRYKGTHNWHATAEAPAGP